MHSSFKNYVYLGIFFITSIRGMFISTFWKLSSNSLLVSNFLEGLTNLEGKDKGTLYCICCSGCSFITALSFVLG